MKEGRKRLRINYSNGFFISFQKRAHELDTKNTSLKNSRGNIMHRRGKALYQEMYDSYF